MASIINIGISNYKILDIDFASNDVAVLQSTNGLLCPGDLVAYRQRENRGNTKTATIVRLLDPSTPDKKEVTLANRDILRPYIHEVRRVKMYGGGACGLLTDPLSTWMKLENCTFLWDALVHSQKVMSKTQIPVIKTIAVFRKVCVNDRNVKIFRF